MANVGKHFCLENCTDGRHHQTEEHRRKNSERNKGKTKKGKKHVVDCKCGSHQPRSGSRNPFFGKHHSEEAIASFKETSSQSSKKLWQDPVYREKVIKRVSKPRHEGFAEAQRVRMLKWWREHSEQRKNRAADMKETWKSGRMVQVPHSKNSSVQERELYDHIAKVSPWPVSFDSTVKIGNRWFFPDILIPDIRLIIEFYGNFWHGNPRMFKAGDVVRNHLTAVEIWQTDAERQRMLETTYRVQIVWEDDYQKNREKIVKDIDRELNWEGDLCF